MDSISRSSTTVLVATAVTAVVAACTLFYLNASALEADPSSGLHRSNAIHRRRRTRDERRRRQSGADDDIRLAEDETEAGDGRDRHGSDLDRDSLGLGPRNGQNILQLLFRVSEDATRKSAYVHRGCACNSCSMVPIRGTRYRCANCADFDLCEACEAQGLHTKTHVFYKVRIPASNLGPKQMQPVWYPGDPENCLRVLPKELVARLSKETGFERPELDAYWEQFTFMANSEWREDPDELCLAMDRPTFDRALVPSGGSHHVAPNLIHDRMFAFYDTNHDNLIGFSEFVHGLAYRRKKDRLRKIFEGYDVNGDGYVDRKDFLRMFRSYYVLFKHMHEEVLEGLEDQAMNSSDALQLVSSRQPISSAFGRDGRYSTAPETRAGEGKVSVNGDLTLNDGLGVVSESSNDQGDRNDTIVEAFAREFRRNNPPILFENRYWATLVNPPEPDELQNGVLEGFFQDRPMRRSAPTREHDVEDYDRIDWPPPVVTQSDVDEICAGHTIATVPLEKRRDVIEAALSRLHAESIRHQAYGAFTELHDRWKRRQFYTDEEEGAAPPLGWNDAEDVLKRTRSHSSSRVRFADGDEDDASVRSVPERWGGMEISDAERDAGKEILYQVTQQALNELLDQLFKKEEDLAIEVMVTKKERDKYRKSFSSPEFSKWAAAKDKNSPFGKSTLRPREAIYSYLRKSRDVRPSSPQELRRSNSDVDLEDMRQHSLDHLLEMSGYTVEEPVVGVDMMPRRAPVSASSQDAWLRGELVAEMEHLGSLDEAPRDPTMPQFRPNTDRPEPDKVETFDASWWQYLLRLRRLDMLEDDAERRGGWGRLTYDEFAKLLDGRDTRIDYLGGWIDFCIPNGS